MCSDDRVYRQLAFEVTPVPTSSSFLKIPSITFSLPLNSSSGRDPSEVPERLRDGLLAGGISAENISVVLPEEDAVKAALDMARPCDLVVLLYIDHNRTWDLLTAACGKQNQGTEAC